MTNKDDKLPDPKRLEKEIGDFLSEKFGGRVKLISPIVIPQEVKIEEQEGQESRGDKKKRFDFSLKPDELEAHLDQYIVKQSEAKEILATKICTHFNRIRRAQFSGRKQGHIVGNVKNNILMIGPTGVGKTYMIKLIAEKIGVPFVKGDATKFSETGYVGGDVEDLVRDLVKEADGDIELAEYGIVYIDEIDKIASSRNISGPDVSRTGVQRALLKPMEETDVELKNPHDPISMMEEIERYRKSGQRKRSVVNTKNILFIMSGAFADLGEMIRNRIVGQGIGFGATVSSSAESASYLKKVSPEDLVKFGFEFEFIGRLPVIAVFDKLEEVDLFHILRNPNNPIILSKKLDFRAYGIDVAFSDAALKVVAHQAFQEGTGARGLVSVIEKALIPFEKKLPSTAINIFPVTEDVMKAPRRVLEDMVATEGDLKWDSSFEELKRFEWEFVRDYLEENRVVLGQKHGFEVTSIRASMAARISVDQVCEVDASLADIKDLYNEVKQAEAFFGNTHSLNIELKPDAVDLLMTGLFNRNIAAGDIYKQLSSKFEYGLKLVRDQTGMNDFVLSKQAIENPEMFLDELVRRSYGEHHQSSDNNEKGVNQDVVSRLQS